MNSLSRWVKGLTPLHTLLLVITLLATAPLSAAVPIHDIDATSQQFDVGSHSALYVDRERRLGLGDVASPDFPWEAHPPQTISAGYERAAYWLHFEVRNRFSNARNLYLELANPLHDRVDVYVLEGERLLSRQQAGDTVHSSSRLLDHRHFIFPLTIEARQQLRLFVRVESSSAMQLPLHLYTSDAFVEHDQQSQLVQGIYFGIILIMVFYNAFIFTVVREKAYLYYVLYAGVFLLFQSALQGIAQQHLPSVDWLRENVLLLGGLLSILFAALFARAFLDLDKHAPRLARLLKGCSLLSALGILALSVSPYTPMAQFMLAMAMLTSTLILVSGIHLWRQGHPSARLFTFAWVTILTAFIFAALSKLGVLPGMIQVDKLIQIGSVMEIALLSLALADRINHEKARRYAIQQQLLKTEQGQKEKLEAEVAVRTEELNQALDQLQSANVELKLISRTDPLTQVPNRHYFNERFAVEYADARRNELELSLVIFDIDHFKRINDTYGHPEGDRVLRAVATTMKAELKRPRDEVYRYGGEEFIALFPNTPRADARQIAQRILQKIEGMTFDAIDASLQITLSAGVSSSQELKEDAPADNLLLRADQALYRAKAEGRNRVA